jgi:hypothetical protein
LEYARQVVHHVTVPKTDDVVAVASEFRGSRPIGHLLPSMLTAVEFDDELMRRAGEVGDVGSDRVLSAKAVRKTQFAQGTP